NDLHETLEGRSTLRQAVCVIAFAIILQRLKELGVRVREERIAKKLKSWFHRRRVDDLRVLHYDLRVGRDCCSRCFPAAVSDRLRFSCKVRQVVWKIIHSHDLVDIADEPVRVDPHSTVRPRAKEVFQEIKEMLPGTFKNVTKRMVRTGKARRT